MKNNFLKFKVISFIFIFLGLLLLTIGFYKNYNSDIKDIYKFINKHPERFSYEKRYLFKKKYYQNNRINNSIIEETSILFYNRPWSALYTASIFFTGITLGSLFFLAIQYISQSGWSIIIIRVMESIFSFFPYCAFIIFIIIGLNCIKYINMFHWMDESLYNIHSNNYDEILNNRILFLNKKFFFFRSLLYIIICIFFIKKIKFFSKKLDENKNIKYFNKLYNISVYFIIFFSISSVIISWDWIMSLEPHWISTLFSWYVISGYILTGISTITIFSIFLKKIKVLTIFNENHLYDLSKYIFSSSLLWSYFWLSQFLLYWYGNIPEEIIYFLTRSNLYKSIHLWMMIPNLGIPFITLITSKIKKNSNLVLIIAIIVLIGQYINIYSLIMPGSVGPFYGFGILEIGSLLLLFGLFLIIFIKNIIKNSILPIGNIFLKESINFNLYQKVK